MPIKKTPVAPFRIVASDWSCYVAVDPRITGQCHWVTQPDRAMTFPTATEAHAAVKAMGPGHSVYVVDDRLKIQWEAK